MLPDNLASLRVVDLKAELVKRKLSTKGKKDELVVRLQQWIDEEKKSAKDQDNVEATESAAATEQTALATEEPQEQEEKDEFTKPVEMATKSVEKLVKEPVEEPVIAAAVAAAVAAPDASSVIPCPTTTKDQEPTPSGTSSTAAATEPESKPDASTHTTAPLAPEPEISETVNAPVAKESGKASNVDRGEKRKREEEKRVEDEGHEKRNKTESVDNTEEIKSSAIYIKGFVRPLITRNVQELIKQFGEVKRFWMDSIKTHCYVIYAETAQAIAAHKGIHGIVFPKENGRKLAVGGLTPEQAEILIEQEQNAADRRIKMDWETLITSVCNGELSKESEATANVLEGRRPRLQGISQITRELQKAMTASAAVGPESAHAPSGEDRPMREPMNVTAETQAPQPTPAPAPAPAPTSSLDDLFRKTATLPHLYYLPVPEEVAQQKLGKVQQGSSA